MYLVHKTSSHYLGQIIRSGSLKPSKLTGHLNEGDGIYKTSDYTYFSTAPPLSKFKIGSNDVLLYFSSKFLEGTNFYVSDTHVSNPDKTSKIEKQRYY